MEFRTAFSFPHNCTSRSGIFLSLAHPLSSIVNLTEADLQRHLIWFKDMKKIKIHSSSWESFFFFIFYFSSLIISHLYTYLKCLLHLGVFLTLLPTIASCYTSLWWIKELLANFLFFFSFSPCERLYLPNQITLTYFVWVNRWSVLCINTEINGNGNFKTRWILPGFDEVQLQMTWTFPLAFCAPSAQ